MPDSFYPKWSDDDTSQTKKKIKLYDNGDDTYSIGVLNNPKAMSESTKAYIINRAEVPILWGDELNPLVTIRNDSADKTLRLGTLSIATDGSKPVIFEVYKNATLTDSDFIPYGGDSYSSYDISSTLVAGGELVGGLVLNKTDSIRINLFSGDVFIEANANETLTIACKSSIRSDITFFIRHLEAN